VRVVRLSWRLIFCAAGLVAGGGAQVTGPTAGGPARGPFDRGASGSQAWLGLNYNSDAGVGTTRDFAVDGIVYDRDGRIEPGAGDVATPTSRLGRALSASFDAGMTPDIEVDPVSGPAGCTANPNPSALCLPTTSGQIDSFVAGFVATAQSVLASFPGKRVLFEPMDEPWNWASPPGTPSGYAAAAEYAAMLARLLPTVAAATRPSIPLADVYVPATGTLSDRSSWVADLYRAQPCLAPGAGPCVTGERPTPISGWNVHPYGLPGSSTEGIGSLLVIRQGMRSGQDNIVASEFGFCATDVGLETNCVQNQSDTGGDSRQVATWLAASLREALPMHRAGWLRALILWARSYPYQEGGTGWAMQNPDGSLTAMGAALVQFASENSVPGG
jgi:hypothetical protein